MADLLSFHAGGALFVGRWAGVHGLDATGVTAAGWVTPEEFADAVAVGNALPGPIAAQVSAYIGFKMAGVPGAIPRSAAPCCRPRC